MQYILDACTIINLLHIDEDSFLMRKLNSIEFKICQKVFDETRRNVKNKFKNKNPYPLDITEVIDHNIEHFRRQIFHDNSYLELSDSIQEQINYSKENGEYFSILLSYYLNTFEKSHILFFTDDSPAKKHFNPFLNHNKIGYILDSVDMLVLLYRQNQDFTSNDLKKFLSSLYSEYASDLTAIQKKINELEIPKSQIRNKIASNNLHKMKKAFNDNDLELATIVYNDVYNQKKENQYLYEALSEYSSFFYKNTSSEFLVKINQHLQFVDSQPFYKFFKN